MPQDRTGPFSFLALLVEINWSFFGGGGRFVAMAPLKHQPAATR